MNYLEILAEEIRREVGKSDLPDENSKLLFRVYAVLLRSKGEAVEASDVHDAWVAWMCSIDLEHEALVPFDDLPFEVAEMDDSYVEAIRLVARRRNL